MMTEFEEKSLKVIFDGSNLGVNYGDLVLKTDIEAVRNAITSVVGVVNLDMCLKLGVGAVAATSLYVAAKCLKAYLPWVNIQDVNENNVLKVAVPKKHEEKFNKLLAEGKITQKVKMDFEDLDTTLMRFLGDHHVKQKEILDLIEKVRIKSVETPCVSEISANTTAGVVMAGYNSDEIHNRNVKVIGFGKGLVAGELMTNNARVERKIYGGTIMVERRNIDNSVPLQNDNEANED
ncbi:uncharacterized protein LOC120335924 isoform X1 [Styela clava]